MIRCVTAETAVLKRSGGSAEAEQSALPHEWWQGPFLLLPRELKVCVEIGPEYASGTGLL